MNHFNEPLTALFLLRVSAENNTLRVVVVGGGDHSRAAFSNLQSALSHIEQLLAEHAACSSNQRQIGQCSPANEQTCPKLDD